MVAVPAGSWDVHVHIFDPVGHPYIPDTRYNPPARSVNDLVASVPSTNFVIVMSGPEGTDTALTVEAMEQLRSMGRDARGMVVLDLEQMTPEELRRLDQAGVRGVRFNTRREGFDLDKHYEAVAQRLHTAGVKWNVEAAIFDYLIWHSLIPTFRRLHEAYGTVFVADHVFALDPKACDPEKLADILQLVDEGVLYVKISGLDRYSRRPEELLPIIRDILSRRGGRGGLWGSDWPNVDSSPGSTSLNDVDIEGHLALLKGVCDDLGNDTWEKLMASNAAELYA
jgi:predicted TIM-barrel fold metal-dependent hydrolase